MSASGPSGPLVNGSSSFFQVTRTAIKSWMSSKFGKIRPGSVESSALEHVKNSHRLYGRNVMSTLVRSFLDESSSFLQVMRKTI